MPTVTNTSKPGSTNLLIKKLARFPKQAGFTLIKTRPHPSRNFTQGLIIEKNYFYESSGHYGRSYLSRYPINIQKKNWLLRLFQEKIQTQRIDRSIFAEGLTLFKDKLYLLSWKAGRVFRFDADTLEPIDEFYYSGEGWGLTHNNHELIRSDGSDQLYFHDANNFKLLREITVYSNHVKNKSVNNNSWNNLNELEYANGLIWANQWQQQHIIAIDPSTGQVVKIVDLSRLMQQENPKKSDSVLNGIAYDHKQEGLWVTGKYWRNIYLIKIQ